MTRPDVNFVVSHVASAQTPVYLCGHRCLEQIGILPLHENLGYGVLILSYNQTRCIGMSGDLGVISDLERMKHYVEITFEQLKIAASRQGRVAAHSQGAEFSPRPRRTLPRRNQTPTSPPY
jgi:WS/DGAT C-terminal domain